MPAWLSTQNYNILQLSTARTWNRAQEMTKKRRDEQVRRQPLVYREERPPRSLQTDPITHPIDINHHSTHEYSTNTCTSDIRTCSGAGALGFP